MKNKPTTNYAALTIPSREDFHREYAGKICISDFNTCYPGPYNLSECIQAFKFNNKNKELARQRR